MLTKRSFYLLVLFSIGWFACKKVDIQFGDQYLDNGYTQVVKVDSFAADLSTVYVDSFVTSGTGVTMLGAYTDPVFGQITANNYFELAPPIYGDTYVDSFKFTTYDSLALVLHPDKSYIGDTSRVLHVDVNRLAESIVPYDNPILNIYNTRSFAVQTGPIGSKDFLLRPNSGDSVIIRLSDVLGNELMKKFQNPNDADLKSNDAFLQYFYGLRLSAGAGSQLIFGSKDSVTMRLYYKKPGLYLQSKTVDFALVNKTHHFNNIVVDRSAAVLKNLPAAKQINSTAMSNTAYTMYAAGAMAKIRFPSIRDILKLPNFAKILRASLIVRPLRGTYGINSYTLPPAVRLSFTTQLNQIGIDLTAIGSSGQPQTQTGALVVDDLYGENTSYSYDVTTYLKAIVTDGTINQNGLLLIPPSPSLETQFGRLIVGNRNNTGGKMELIIVYAAVQ
ncbi:MAG: DUF4270 family protein [Bacteroidota bacterium]